MITSPDFNLSSAIELVQQPHGETLAGTRSQYMGNIQRDTEHDFSQDLVKLEKFPSIAEEFEPRKLTGFAFDDDQLRAIRDQSVFLVPDIIRRIPVQKPYEMSEVAREFISRQKRSADLDRSLDIVSTGISGFMKEHAIRTKIVIDVETDTEFDDWTEPRIKILVDQSELERAYDIFGDLLDQVLHKIRKREMKRFRITLDAR